MLRDSEGSTGASRDILLIWGYPIKWGFNDGARSTKYRNHCYRVTRPSQILQSFRTTGAFRLAKVHYGGTRIGNRKHSRTASLNQEDIVLASGTRGSDPDLARLALPILS